MLTFAGPLNGENSLTVLNGGYVAPTNTSNTYSGGTTINSGTTLLVSSDGLTAGSTSELGLVPATAATNITINGGTLEATSTFALNSNRGISLGSSGGTIDVNGLNGASPNTLTYGGIIANVPMSVGSLTLTDTGTLVLSGPNSYTGGTNISSGTLRAGALNTIPQSSAVTLGLGGTLQLNGFSQSIGSLTGGGTVTNNSSTSAILTVGNDSTSPAAYYGVISDTTGNTTGSLALNKVGSGTLTLTGLNSYSGGTSVNGGTLIVATAPILAANSTLQVNAGTLQFNFTSGAATVQSGVTATVAAAATLQLAGSVSALSDGSAINPADGQLVNITNNGATASGGGLLVTGTNQSVGTIVGSLTNAQGSPNTYSGDTVVGPGGSLTATQILQNTLTIGAGATVTLRPATSVTQAVATSSDLVASDAANNTATANQIQMIQNRIAQLEQLETNESSSNASPLDETSPAALATTSGIANPAAANPAVSNSIGDVDPALLAREIAALVNEENTLLAEENSTENSASGGATAGSAFSAAESPFGGPSVPEPSAVVLALIAAGLAGAWAAFRLNSRHKLDLSR